MINADETGWREDRHKAWLWVAVTALSTVFTIARDRTAKVARTVLGTQGGAIAVTDRCSSYDWIAAVGRQICWSHLRRDFQAMIDRGGAAEPIGTKPLRLSDRLLRWWHRLEAEEVDRGRFGTAMARLRREVRTALGDGGRCEGARTRGTCAEILRVEASLWTFARVVGVPPTNNAAERAERHAVIWRRISGGTDSAEGSRFVERMLTVVATCRQQGRNVLDYLTSCFEAARRGQAIPSLVPATPPKIEVAQSQLSRPVNRYCHPRLVNAYWDSYFMRVAGPFATESMGRPALEPGPEGVVRAFQVRRTQFERR